MEKKLLILFFVIFFIRVSTWFLPMVIDAHGYAYTGSVIAKGAVMYTGVWDHKPPGIDFLNAIVFFLSPSYIFGLRIASLLFSLLSVVLFYKLLSEFFDRKTSELTTLFFVIFTNVYMVTQGDNLIEGYMLPFLILSYILIVHGIKTKKLFYFLLCGFCIGILFVFKQVGILPFGALGIFFFLERKDFGKRIGIISFGFILSIFPIVLYFVFHHAFLEMLDAIFLYNFFYAGQGYSISSLGQSFFYTLQVIFATLPLWFLTVIGTLRIEWKKMDILFMLLLFFSFLGTALGGQYAFTRNYFLLMFPAMGYFSASAVREIVLLSNKQLVSKKILFTGLFFLSLPSLSLQAQSVLAGLYFQRKLPVSSEQAMYAVGLTNFNFVNEEKTNFSIAEYIKKHTVPNTYILAWDAVPEIYLFSNTVSPTRYFYNFPINGTFIHDPKQEERQKIFLREIKNNKPIYIIANKNDQRHSRGIFSINFSAFIEFIRANYHQETIINNQYIFHINEKKNH